MTRFTIRVLGAVILYGSLAATMPARGDDRSAAAILKEIDAIKVPEIDESRLQDSAYVQRFHKEEREATNRRAPLIGALYRADPENPQLVTLLPERWEALAGKIGSIQDKKPGKELIAELNELIAKANSAELKIDAAYWKAKVASTIAADSTAKIKAVDEFIALAPKDERGADLLFELGSLFLEFDPAEQKALYARIVKDYPDSGWTATARGKVRQFDGIGKPFDLEFTDAISGAEISMKGLKGKVVVIGFWDTDCPTMIPTKKLYAEYKDKGVEFIGVSLDPKEGGLEMLKAFVAKEGISWPQYFQGDGWESNFSVSWGIDGIPAVFVVDQQGKLFSVEYADEDELETMIAELLSGRLAATTPARGDDRSAAAILKEIDAIKVPEIDDSRENDSAYVKRIEKEKSQATKRKTNLIRALYQADPDNPELATLLPERWTALACLVQGRHGKTVAKDLTGELNDVIARAKSDELKKDAAYWKAQVASSSAKDSGATLKAIDDFIALAPKDERGAQLLFFLRYSLEVEPAEQKALYARIVKEYPDSRWAEVSEGSLRRIDAIGKPFDLAFTDALTGAEISMTGLKGKVIVIDFWATWCGPCVDEMPALKKLYAEYKDKGVEFIGVSLDNKVGGLGQLEALDTNEGIAWPQYFQGDGFDSKFSTSWGINSIPKVFLVDQQGKLVSVEARGKLETMIPELLNRPLPNTGGSENLAVTVAARGDDRSAGAILKEIDAVKLPVFDDSRREDKAYSRRFNQDQSEATKRKADLIGALYRADPENSRLATLLPERWRALAMTIRVSGGMNAAKALTGELNEVIAKAKSDELKKDAAYWKAQVNSFSSTDDTAKTKAVDEFIAFAPKDARGANLLYSLTLSLDNDPAQEKALYERIAKEYPDDRLAELARGCLRRLDAIGRPFDLAFTNALSGAEISMNGLKGKVVVIDFWATWCGPCVREMLTMKKLYADYKDKGVEFIGVSLDEKEGGLAKLKEFVKKEGIAWPQYFQGDEFASTFSASWGINAIPTVFLVDPEGKLVSVDAGDRLETMIPALLNRPAPKAGADDRSAAAILKEIDAIKVPEIDESKENDSAYVERFEKEKSEATNRRAPLILELGRADPDNPQLATLLPERWEALAGKIESIEDTKPGKVLIAELNEWTAKAKSAELKKAAAYLKAQVARIIANDSTAKIKAIDEFIALAPKDERGADLLFELGWFAFDDDPAVQPVPYARIINEYPDSSLVETARGKLRQIDAVGKPFDLEFTDAISGDEISMKDLKGNVVVIGFWDTDCAYEIPTLKKLYAEYQDKGVEFIGVSLDPKEGGLEMLKAFVAKEGISWPQYFQGDGWDSKFSVSWGIDSLPASFLVDQQGRLVSVEVSGILETMIPELLNRRASKGGEDDRSAGAILKEIAAVRIPVFDTSRQGDEAYVKRFSEEEREAVNRKAVLIGALYQADPDSPELATLLPRRWKTLASMVRHGGGTTIAKYLTGELNEVIAAAKSDEMKKDAAYWKAKVASSSANASAAKLKAIDEFIALAPKDQRGADLLFSVSDSLEDEPAQQKTLYERIVKEYPDSPRAESALGKVRQIDTVGKSFDLEFTEAQSGSEISMKGLKGKVVVIDFWATWCGPCVAEMPTMKKLYAEYKDKGVEFIGVSLDNREGGLEALKAFVTKEGIAWPQYFQGDGWESRFSASWGINAIPAVFVVDEEGKLFSIEARGQLETMIPELLNRPVPKAAGDGGR